LPCELHQDSSKYDGFEQDLSEVNGDMESPFGLHSMDEKERALNSSEGLAGRVDFVGIAHEDQFVPSSDRIHSKFPPEPAIRKSRCQQCGNSKRFIEIMGNRK
jgi:hypothetical protein